EQRSQNSKSHGANDDQEEYRTLHATRGQPGNEPRQPLWKDWHLRIGRCAAAQERSEKSSLRPGRTADRRRAHCAKGYATNADRGALSLSKLNSSSCICA